MMCKIWGEVVTEIYCRYSLVRFSPAVTHHGIQSRVPVSFDEVISEFRDIDIDRKFRKGRRVTFSGELDFEWVG